MLKLAINFKMAGFDEALEIKHRINYVNQQEMEGVKVRKGFRKILRRKEDHCII